MASAEETSTAQRFQTSDSVPPSTGSARTQSGAGGNPADSDANTAARSCAALASPAGAASTMGTTITTAASATIASPAPTPPSTRRSAANTGQVVNTRMPAHSRADRNGSSTSAQPAPSAPSSSQSRARSRLGESLQTGGVGVSTAAS